MSTVRQLAGAVAAAIVLSLSLAVPVAVAADSRCPVSASFCHYQLPAGVQSARNACYRAERDARGIPHSAGAYRAWWATASGSARADYTRAFTRCQDRYQLPAGRWSWGSMVYVGSD